MVPSWGRLPCMLCMYANLSTICEPHRACLRGGVGEPSHTITIAQAIILPSCIAMYVQTPCHHLLKEVLMISAPALQSGNAKRNPSTHRQTRRRSATATCAWQTCLPPSALALSRGAPPLTSPSISPSLKIFWETLWAGTTTIPRPRHSDSCFPLARKLF